MSQVEPMRLEADALAANLMLYYLDMKQRTVRGKRLSISAFFRMFY